jgi:hypothetical protein
MCPGCVHNLSEVRPPTEWVGSCVFGAGVGVAVGVGVVDDKTHVSIAITPLQCICNLTNIPTTVFCGFPIIKYLPFFLSYLE